MGFSVRYAPSFFTLLLWVSFFKFCHLGLESLSVWGYEAGKEACNYPVDARCNSMSDESLFTDSLFFTNFVYNPEVYYFFYIGELKSYSLTGFLNTRFGKLQSRPVQCVAIIPDLHEQYNYANLIVPAPTGADREFKGDRPVSFRRNTSKFFADVSGHPTIQSLVARILEQQEELYIYMFESDAAMTLDEQWSQVYLLGPDKGLARKFNNKAVQFELLRDTVPLVDFRTCGSLPELLEVAEELRSQWQDGIFVSRMYSAAGSGSIITTNQEQITDFFSELDAPFLLTRYMPHEHDPTVLAVVANEKDVYIAGVADQCIEGGNHFVGSTWPSRLAANLIDELARCTRLVGQMLGRNGYRGIFGCDYIITEQNEVRFIEINARKQGTTLEFCYTLEQILPAGSPSLPELECYAVLENRFPKTAVEPKIVADFPLCWGTYNLKLKAQHKTCGYIPQAVHEQESFARVGRSSLKKDFLVLEHVGSGLQVEAGTFLARVVAVGKKSKHVDQGLELGRKMIELTITK
jgi:hypothetical protein